MRPELSPEAPNEPEPAGTALLSLHEVKKHFPVNAGLFGRGGQTVKAVDGVSLSIRRGETVGLVGESGCGKSTLGRVILSLEQPTSGQVVFEGQDLARQTPASMRALRRDMQIVFQDPYSALNPRKTVASILGEPFRVHGLHSPAEREAKARELLGIVGLRPEHANRYPHEFSGGQRQRICIARAIALRPKLIVADEAVSALDVSVQAQVLNLLVSLRRQFSLTYVFISHDLRVVRHISDRVGVMYLGRLVELSDTARLYDRPSHPYTKALLSAVPRFGGRTRGKRIILEGDIPSPLNPPRGCAFHPRCLHRRERCEQEAPALREIEPGRQVACHYPLTATELPPETSTFQTTRAAS